MVLLSQRRTRVVRVARVADERGPRAHLDERRLDREERLPQVPQLLLGLVDEAARLRAGFSFGFTLLFFQPIRVCRMKRAGYAWPVSVIKQRTRRYYYF